MPEMRAPRRASFLFRSLAHHHEPFGFIRRLRRAAAVSSRSLARSPLASKTNGGVVDRVQTEAVRRRGHEVAVRHISTRARLRDMEPSPELFTRVDEERRLRHRPDSVLPVVFLALYPVRPGTILVENRIAANLGAKLNSPRRLFVANPPTSTCDATLLQRQ